MQFEPRTIPSKQLMFFHDSAIGKVGSEADFSIRTVNNHVKNLLVNWIQMFDNTRTNKRSISWSSSAMESAVVMVQFNMEAYC